MSHSSLLSFTFLSSMVIEELTKYMVMKAIRTSPNSFRMPPYITGDCGFIYKLMTQLYIEKSFNVSVIHFKLILKLNNYNKSSPSLLVPSYKIK